MLLGDSIIHNINKRWTPKGTLFSIGSRKLGLYKDGIFATKRVPELHYFFKYAGYGLNKQLLMELQPNDVIIINEVGDGKNRKLKATVKEREDGSIRRSYAGEEQAILPLVMMYQIKD